MKIWLCICDDDVWVVSDVPSSVDSVDQGMFSSLMLVELYGQCLPACCNHLVCSSLFKCDFLWLCVNIGSWLAVRTWSYRSSEHHWESITCYCPDKLSLCRSILAENKQRNWSWFQHHPSSHQQIHPRYVINSSSMYLGCRLSGFATVSVAWVNLDLARRSMLFLLSIGNILQGFCYRVRPCSSVDQIFTKCWVLCWKWFPCLAIQNVTKLYKTCFPMTTLRLVAARCRLVYCLYWCVLMCVCWFLLCSGCARSSPIVQGGRSKSAGVIVTE